MIAKVEEADEKAAVSDIPDEGWQSMQTQALPAGQYPLPDDVSPTSPSFDPSFHQDAALQQSQQHFSQTAPQSTQTPPLPNKRSTDRVPIPPLNSAAANGPMSSNVVVPPRPKPGRKPIPVTESLDRRRLQNRIAQRNFRDKRQQKLHETQQELGLAKQKYEERISELTCDKDDLVIEVRDLKQTHENDLAKIQMLRQRVVQLGGKDPCDTNGNLIVSNKVSHAASGSMATAGQQLPMPTHNYRQPQTQGPFREDPAALTPPEFNFQEIDYTNFGRTAPIPRQATNPHPRPTLSRDSTMTAFTPDLQADDGNCGFCTDDQNCLCKAQRSIESAPQAGNCDACMADPARARACRQLAASAQPEDVTMYDAGNRSGSGFQLPNISCEELMDRTKQSGQPLASISELFGSQIHPIASPSGRYEVQEHEAAQALRTLSRRDTRMAL